MRFGSLYNTILHRKLGFFASARLPACLHSPTDFKGSIQGTFRDCLKWALQVSATEAGGYFARVIIENMHMPPVQPNSSTHLRVLLVLTDGDSKRLQREDKGPVKHEVRLQSRIWPLEAQRMSPCCAKGRLNPKRDVTGMPDVLPLITGA
jgi:hypothetical protein